MIILYHANCNDGSASALAAWLKLGDRGHSYIAVTHGRPPPKAVIGEEVVIVDFCYPREVLLNMGAKSVLILDHHISAQKALAQPFPAGSRITAHFDMEKSGAAICWAHFFPDTPLPRLFQYIQDRDIWTNMHPESAFLAYGLRVFSTAFRDWKALLDDPAKLNQAIVSGKAVLTFVTQEIEKIVATRSLQHIAGFTVPVINAPGFMNSDALHRILELEPDAPFTASYSDNLAQGIRNYSLRSMDEREDVSLIAKQLGGGGHRNAAAFTASLPATERALTSIKA